MKAGLIAEFPTPERLTSAVVGLRVLGYRRLDAFTPYPVESVEEALILPRSRIPIVVLAFGLLGAVGAYFIQWWCNAYDYPLRVGGFAAHSPPAYVPIVFETTVLFASLAAFIGCLASNGLPLPYHPLFRVPAFQRAPIDRFFVAIDARDPQFDAVRTHRDLDSLEPLSITDFGGAR